MAERISVKRAAELTGLSCESIRLGILQGVLPFGVSIQRSNKRTLFHISPHKLAEYLGITIEEVKGENRAALTTEQAMERFQIKSITTITELFKKKGSPAYKVGIGRGHWRVDEEDFKKFLQKESEQYKG